MLKPIPFIKEFETETEFFPAKSFIVDFAAVIFLKI